MFSGLDADSVTGSASQLYELGYSRDAEIEADETAADLLRRSGISSKGLVTFFERLQGDQVTVDNSGLFKYFASHPALGERIERLDVAP